MMFVYKVKYISAGMAHLEALEMLSISCTNFMSNTDDVSDDSQDKIDALAEKFTQVYDSDDGKDSLSIDTISH